MSIKNLEIDAENDFFELGEKERQAKRESLSTHKDAGITGKASAAVARARQQALASIPGPLDPIAFKKFVTVSGEVFYIGEISLAIGDIHVLRYLDYNNSDAAHLASELLKSTSREPGQVAISRSFVLPASGNYILDYSEELYQEIVGQSTEMSNFQPSRVRAQQLIDDGVSEDEAYLIASSELNLALQADLARERTSEMADIIRTMLPEQYQVAELPIDGILAVQGGPGTGKTAVALKRLEVLLFLNEEISPEDIAFMGPNNEFHRYIDSRLSMIRGRAGKSASGVKYLDISKANDFGLVDVLTEDDGLSKRVKESPQMFQLVSSALWDSIKEPEEDILVSGFRLSVENAIRLLTEAKREPLYFNGRSRLQMLIANSFVGGKFQAQPTEADVEKMVNRIWPKINPVKFYKGLLTNAEQLLTLGHEEWSLREIRAIYQPVVRSEETFQLSDLDVQIIDWIASQVGRTPKKYKYLIVDECQDLNLWQIKSIANRSLNGSMMLIGDMAQSTSSSFDWESFFAALIQETKLEASAISQEKLTVSFRLPNEIVDFLNHYVQNTGIKVPRLYGVRNSGLDPAIKEADFSEATLIENKAAITSTIGELLNELQRGIKSSTEKRSVAVITADTEIYSSLRNLLPQNVTFLTPRESKGLEFDFVIVLDSCSIHNSGNSGSHSLYVSMSRASQGLGVIRDTNCTNCVV